MIIFMIKVMFQGHRVVAPVTQVNRQRSDPTFNAFTNMITSSRFMQLDRTGTLYMLTTNLLGSYTNISMHCRHHICVLLIK